MATYLITRKDAPEGELPRIVEARMAASALSHVTKTTFGVETITMKQAMDWAKKGVELEEVASGE